VKPYLTVAAIYRNEAPYLREWIEFHRLVGVERFFLYNNESTDDHIKVLAPYIEQGIVVHEDFPGFPPQLLCYQHCIDTHRDDARWMAFIDVDEFLYSPTSRPLPEILRDYEQYNGVAVNCVVFGTSGHETPPPGLVIENYTRRLGLERPRTKTVKAVVNPANVERVGHSAHYFIYYDRERAVDELRRVVRGQSSEAPPSMELLRINHYFTRSQEERMRKLAAPRVDNGKVKQAEGVEERDRRLNEEPDDNTILAYAPALREALGLEPAASGA
jgi:hypothetical protein